MHLGRARRPLPLSARHGRPPRGSAHSGPARSNSLCPIGRHDPIGGRGGPRQARDRRRRRRRRLSGQWARWPGAPRADRKQRRAWPNRWERWPFDDEKYLLPRFPARTPPPAGQVGHLASSIPVVSLWAPNCYLLSGARGDEKRAKCDECEKCEKCEKREKRTGPRLAQDRLRAASSARPVSDERRRPRASGQTKRQEAAGRRAPPNARPIR